MQIQGLGTQPCSFTCRVHSCRGTVRPAASRIVIFWLLRKRFLNPDIRCGRRELGDEGRGRFTEQRGGICSTVGTMCSFSLAHVYTCVHTRVCMEGQREVWWPACVSHRGLRSAPLTLLRAVLLFWGCILSRVRRLLITGSEKEEKSRYLLLGHRKSHRVFFSIF